jgi:hypothetical protein
MGEALRLAPAHPLDAPTQRTFAIRPPDGVLLLVVHDDEILQRVFISDIAQNRLLSCNERTSILRHLIKDARRRRTFSKLLTWCVARLFSPQRPAASPTVDTAHPLLTNSFPSLSTRRAPGLKSDLVVNLE